MKYRILCNVDYSLTVTETMRSKILLHP